jgi:predicted nucleic acid-binding protein
MGRRSRGRLDRGSQGQDVMSRFLDTSIVVRYLTGDPPELADMAAKVLDGEADLKLTDVAIVETAYVLSTVYKITREAVVDSLIALIQKKNVALFALEKQRALEALLLCRPSNRVSFADAFIWAAAKTDGAEAIYSFDERFPEEEIEVRPPASGSGPV